MVYYDIFNTIYTLLPAKYQLFIDYFLYGSLAFILRLWIKGIIDNLMDKNIYMAMDNTDSSNIDKGSGDNSNSGLSKPTTKPSSGGSSIDSTSSSVPATDSVTAPIAVPAVPVTASPSNPVTAPLATDNVSSTDDTSKSDKSPVNTNTRDIVKPAVSHSTLKLDSVFDRQIVRLSASLNDLNLRLSTETDEASIKRIKDSIDGTHDQLAFVQAAKLDSIREIQEASKSTNDLPQSESSSSKRKASEDIDKE